MRKWMIGLFFAFSSLMACAQNEEIQRLVKEGVALNDQGDYEGAIKKYDEALAIDKDDYIANYEKSFTCLYAKSSMPAFPYARCCSKNTPAIPTLAPFIPTTVAQ